MIVQIFVQTWLCKQLHIHTIMNHSCVFHILMIVWFEQSWPCNLHNPHCAICTIMIVQFAQLSLYNLNNHECAICTITIVQYFFMFIMVLYLQNLTSFYNYLLSVYHDCIDDCTIRIFQMDANLCVQNKMSRLSNIDNCIIFHLLKIYLYSMHIWLYNHLKIMTTRVSMQ